MKSLTIPFALGILVAFTLTTNFAMAQVYDFNPNTDIPDFDLGDPGVLTDTQTISETGTITDVDVDLHINHTWQGDLIINITHESTGTVVPLLFRAGDSDGSSFGFSEDNFGDDANRFILDDEASAAYDSTNAAGNGWGAVDDPGINTVSGNWIPYGEFGVGPLGGLNAFDGEDINGDWTLFVSDNAGGDTGTLVSWSLHFTTPIPEPSSALVLLMGMGGLAFGRRRR